MPEKELKIIDEFNNTDDKHFDNKTPKEMLETAIKNNKNKTALIFENERITYNELERRLA